MLPLKQKEDRAFLQGLRYSGAVWCSTSWRVAQILVTLSASKK